MNKGVKNMDSSTCWSELVSVKYEVHLALARGEATAVILLDQPAVFDTIDHSMLIECLSFWFSVGGAVLGWFTSYLCDFYQCIKIGSVFSDAKRLLYGVPKALFWSQSCFHYTLLPSVKLFKSPWHIFPLLSR